MMMMMMMIMMMMMMIIIIIIIVFCFTSVIITTIILTTIMNHCWTSRLLEKIFEAPKSYLHHLRCLENGEFARKHDLRG